MNVLAGNFCSLLAMVTDSVSSSRKTARGVLLVQLLSQVFYASSALFLKGYSAVVQNAISVVRNVAAIRKIENKILEWALVVLGVVLGLYFNNLGWVGVLPVLANLEYTLAVFHYKDDERALKIAFLINAVLFSVFNAVILNFVGAIANIIIIVATTVFLIRDRKQQ